MHANMAMTIAEAEAQTLPEIRYDKWIELAFMLHCYNISQEMGLELSDWYGERVQEFERTGNWGATSLLEYRLLLAWTQRLDYWHGEYVDRIRQFDEVDSLLVNIARLCGQAYSVDLAERERIVQQDAEWRARL